jgi:microcystin-dependent protein
MGQPFAGEIWLAGFNFAAVSWSICNGSLMSISQNPTLFQPIGATYGGDSQKHLRLP